MSAHSFWLSKLSRWSPGQLNFRKMYKNFWTYRCVRDDGSCMRPGSGSTGRDPGIWIYGSFWLKRDGGAGLEISNRRWSLWLRSFFEVVISGVERTPMLSRHSGHVRLRIMRRRLKWEGGAGLGVSDWRWSLWLRSFFKVVISGVEGTPMLSRHSGHSGLRTVRRRIVLMRGWWVYGCWTLRFCICGGGGRDVGVGRICIGKTRGAFVKDIVVGVVCGGWFVRDGVKGWNVSISFVVLSWRVMITFFIFQPNSFQDFWENSVIFLQANALKKWKKKYDLKWKKLPTQSG